MGVSTKKTEHKGTREGIAGTDGIDHRQPRARSHRLVLAVGGDGQSALRTAGDQQPMQPMTLAERPRLAAWWAAWNARPSMAATRYPCEG